MFHYTFHLFSICYEVSRQVTTVELHTFYYTDCSVSTFSFFDSDNTVFRNFAHCICNQFTDNRVVVCRDSSHLFNLVVVIAYSFSLSFNRFYYFSHSLVDTTFQIHWVCTCSNVLQTNTNDSLSQNSCSSCTITGIIASFRSNRFNQLCTCVLESIRQFDFFCYSHTVFSDVRSTEFLFDDNITSFRAQCYFHCVSQFVYTFFQLIASVNVEENIFCHNFLNLLMLN